MTKKITIAIDAMGGDNAPFKTIKGVYLFLKNNVSNSDFQLNLYGDQIKLKEELSKYKISKENIKIIHAESSISDEETPLTAVKMLKIQACGIVLNHKLMKQMLVCPQEIRCPFSNI